MADALFSSLYDIDEYENGAEKIDLDELFDKRRTYLQKEVETYKKILTRIHSKIKVTSRQRMNNDFTTFIVPEFIVGLPRFDVLGCIGYCIEKLKENGFLVRYTHPNMLFISWRHYVPSYERELIKKRTGVKLDEFGKVVTTGIERGGGMGGGGMGGSGGGRLRMLEDTASLEEQNLMMFSRRDRERDREKAEYPAAGSASSTSSGMGASGASSRGQRQYRDISMYAPTGVYNRDLIQ